MYAGCGRGAGGVIPASFFFVLLFFSVHLFRKENKTKNFTKKLYATLWGLTFRKEKSIICFTRKEALRDE